MRKVFGPDKILRTSIRLTRNFKSAAILCMFLLYLSGCKPFATCVHVARGAIFLNINEEQEFEVFSAEYYSCDYLKVETGQVYNFIVSDKSKWKDLNVTCDASGWHNKLLKEKRKRVKNTECFVLCGTIGTCDSSAFAIGNSLANHEIKQNGDLHFFANDHQSRFFYRNNSGSIKVKVLRVH